MSTIGSRIKMKPSVETVLAISRNYDIKNEWLLLGNDNSESTEKVLSVLKIDEKEGYLLSEFRKLKPSDHFSTSLPVRTANSLSYQALL